MGFSFYSTGGGKAPQRMLERKPRNQRLDARSKDQRKTRRRDRGGVLRCRLRRAEVATSLHSEIFRRFLAAVRDDIERHLGAIRQAVQAGPLDGRYMDEDVLAAAIRRNETITLLPVKPLHCTARHAALPRNNDCSSRAAIAALGKQKPAGVNRRALIA